MAFYARLKKDVVETPRYGIFLYPGDQYRPIDDRYYALAQKDERLEILTSDEMAKVVQQDNQLIDDLVNGQWRHSAKVMSEITDIVLLEKVLERAKAFGKAKIVEITGDRIDELEAGK